MLYTLIDCFGFLNSACFLEVTLKRSSLHFDFECPLKVRSLAQLRL